MSKSVHCDGFGCDSWASKKMAKEAGFMILHWEGSTWHFCSWDCVLRYAATRNPLEVL